MRADCIRVKHDAFTLYDLLPHLTTWLWWKLAKGKGWKDETCKEDIKGIKLWKHYNEMKEA